ncbi:sensor histidine kinase [Kitasatospora cathayae]|uniref:histidine kinase n=1 Tax=Kitasatospora cathayae TaxID=3004092 RepID=A0ABY7PZP2_9ACTN|nr:nitrate- and nitrite sensing domain-containing protein [Kitasatospora sp. HUAS 3-15]WBP85907.1 nitrate- and nitrite sensing domain-containing protein [Kitasatospora sp. HUAS 3-15]
MRLRSSSIRAKIIALLLVPIVALIALWVYATLAATGDAWNQLAISRTYKDYGTAVDQYAGDLQNERRAAVQHLADPNSPVGRDAFEHASTATDRSLAVLRQKKDAAGDRLSAAQRARLVQIIAAADQLGPLRAQVGRLALNWEFALGQYSDLVRPVFGFRSAYVARQSGQLPRQGTILIELVRAREYLSQEDAAMEGLRTGGTKPTSEQYQAALDALHNQQALFTVYIAELEPADQADYIALRGGEAWGALARAEADFVGAGGPERVVQALNVDNWRETADHSLGDLSAIDSRIAAGLDDRGRSAAIAALWRGGIAGAIGLVAVTLSVVISLRIGRGLARELINLRNAANELATTRLPAVMLRLRRGEAVDVAVEAPELHFGQAEIGQVGQAINAVQRAAVEAAVEQAELRRGVAAVFVNLARRSQVLLHRQLTLLDTMERRTEDPAELEDLFKVDHLTTRMRRHAEGLIILAGGSPGRAWRKPVRMVDVVRAAVGEVEDYARVIVRPFPGTGLLGSAVADVTHLVAELVENAAVFSPPNTQVTVQGEVVAHGFALEIDDRGLGLSEQLLAEINERLAVEQEFDLADTDRLGLFVVSRLARRHGIRVHLRPSPYGGTTAVVLIPRELLAEAPDGLPEPPTAGAGARRPAGRTGGRPAGRRDLVAVPDPASGDGAGGSARTSTGTASASSMASSSGTASGTTAASSSGTASGAVPAAGTGGRHRVTGGPRPSVPEAGRTANGLPRRAARTKGGPVLVPAPGPDTEGGAPGTGRHRWEAEAAAGLPVQVDAPPVDAVPVEVTALDAVPVDAVPRTPGGLPRRVRQANLAPQLKELAKERLRGETGSGDRAGGPVAEAAEARDAGEAREARGRSPEEARATFASFQRGFTRGRGATGPADRVAQDRAALDRAALDRAALDRAARDRGPQDRAARGRTAHDTPAAADRPTVPAWQPPDPSRRAISPAPAPAALPAPAPEDAGRASLARRIPSGQSVRRNPAGASPVPQVTPSASVAPAVSAVPAPPAGPVVPVEPAVPAVPAPPAPAEGTDS